MQKYLRYSEKRDTLFVLGAGASHPDGVPLQRHILPMILSGKFPEIDNSPMGIRVKEFIKENFHYEADKGFYPQLEAVFSFIDYFLEHHESLNSKFTNSVIGEIKEDLIKIIHFIVNLRTEDSSPAYHKFWESVSKFNKNISIITLNYDTLLEQAFDFIYPNNGLIDYCIHLMNYQKLEKLKNFSFWVNPREPVNVEPDSDPVPIKIIKVHGSLNWKYCNCCNQTLLTPWDRKIDLTRRKFLGYTFPEQQEYDYYCPNDGTEFHTLILPPTFTKTLTQPVISQLLSEASREITSTKKIVFVGYSFSYADVHIKALFKKQLRKDVEVIVINTRNSQNLKSHYYSLTNNLRFINMPFEELVKNESLMEEILM